MAKMAARRKADDKLGLQQSGDRIIGLCGQIKSHAMDIKRAASVASNISERQQKNLRSISRIEIINGSGLDGAFWSDAEVQKIEDFLLDLLHARISDAYTQIKTLKEEI